MLTPLKEVRLKQNFRQEDVAQRSGIPQPRYSRIERGVASPTTDEKQAITKAFFGEKVEHASQSN